MLSTVKAALHYFSIDTETFMVAKGMQSLQTQMILLFQLVANGLAFLQASSCPSFMAYKL